MRLFFVMLVAFFVAGCGGYKPVANYSKSMFEEPVIVKVKIDPEDPSTGEYLQDEIIRMAVNRLNLTITKNVNSAKSYIIVNSYTINTSPITKDDNGNVIRYSINAAIEFAVKDKEGFWSKNIVSSEYVSVKAQSSISEVAKDKATKLAIKKALDDFVLAVMKRGQEISKKEIEKKQEDGTNNSNNQQESQSTYSNTANNQNTNSSPVIDEEPPAVEEPIEQEMQDSADEQSNDESLNVVVVDDEETQNGLKLNLNENSTPTKILSY